MEGVLDLFLAAMVQNLEGYHSKQGDRPMSVSSPYLSCLILSIVKWLNKRRNLQ